MTVLRTCADEMKVGEIDDAVLSVGISYYLAEPEIIRQFPKKWKYSNAFLALTISCI